jgi:pimeloyl-ACP methyl ester carboxylesterase
MTLSQIQYRRRHLLGAAAAAAAHLSPGRAPLAQATQPSFPPLRQIDAGLLGVSYVEMGPVDGPVVLLLHGWPYDIHSYIEVAPLLATKGYRTIVPFGRGYGPTRFLADTTLRNGQQSALAVDVIAVMDALKIENAIFAGYDWGARTANIVAALWPKRCRGLVSVSGYLIGSRDATGSPCRPRLSSNGGTSTTSPPNAAALGTANTAASSPG